MQNSGPIILFSSFVGFLKLIKVWVKFIDFFIYDVVNIIAYFSIWIFKIFTQILEIRKKIKVLLSQTVLDFSY